MPAGPPSALFTALSLHQLGAEGPPWDPPLLLAPWLLSHSQLCFSLWFINRLDVSPFSVAQVVLLCYGVSLLFFLINFFIEG